MRVTVSSMAAVLSALSLSGCDKATPGQATSPVATIRRAATPPAVVPTTYTWDNMNSGPGCLPRLRQVMDWYATQAQTIRQFEFIPGATTAGPVSGGPYSVDIGAVDVYLALLRKTNYFSNSYLDSLRSTAQLQAIKLQHAQSVADVIPTVQGLPLFALNYDDMLEQSQKFVFTPNQRNNTVLFNDGIGMQRFAFDKDCRVLSVKWIGYASK